MGGPPGARRATHADRPDQCGSHVTQTGCVQLPCLAPDSPTRGHCVNGRAYLRLQTAGWVRTTTVAVGTRNTSCVLARYKKAVPFDCPKYMRQRPASGLRSAAIWLLVQLTVASSAPHVVIRKPKLIARRRPSARLPSRRPPHSGGRRFDLLGRLSTPSWRTRDGGPSCPRTAAPCGRRTRPSHTARSPGR